MSTVTVDLDLGDRRPRYAVLAEAAVARKLATLLHHLWVMEGVYLADGQPPTGGLQHARRVRMEAGRGAGRGRRVGR